jgi:trans-aconitate 2-methyltransferase
VEARVSGSEREWNAEAYDRLADPQREWGRTVMDRLQLQGDETVLDAGCGAGGLTAELLERLPHGRVIAIDASRQMVSRARALLEPRFGDRVELQVGDLAELPFDGVADAIFSSAVFHHIQDHEALFAGLYRALVPGGRLAAQCGGGPNLVELQRHVAAVADADPRLAALVGWPGPWNNAGAPETASRLDAAGFVDVVTWVTSAPVHLPDAARMREHLETINLRSHLARLPDAAAQAALLDGVVVRMASADPPMTLDHWRLNMAARRPAE